MIDDTDSDDAEVAQTSLEKTAALANLLSARLEMWERDRKPQELKMLECYMDVMRIPRDDDTAGAGHAKSKKAKGLFVGSTRNKVRATRAKINDSLFGNGELPFDTEPTNEQSAPYSDAVETICKEQLEKMGFKSLIRAGVSTLATYGTGFMFGPLVRKETLTESSVDQSLGIPKLVETRYEYDAPYFERGNTLDVYPDSEARNIKDGLGVFWVTMESRHTVEAWKADKSYANIDAALVCQADNSNETGSEIATQNRANVEYWHKGDRIKVARFFGKVPRKVMPSPAIPEPSTELEDAGEMVTAIVIMAGGVVVKANEAPYGEEKWVYRCGFEEVDDEMWAVGVAENNSPHQKIVNSGFRLFNEGKGMALLGTKSVDRSMFLPGEDFRKSPGKVYQMKPGLSPEERKTAIIEHVDPDVSGGWIDVIRMSEQYSDDDTGITKYTQGDDSRNLNKTAAGISMIMSASSLPLKEVIQNIDANWLEEMYERLINWNLKYLEVETVKRIHGDEIADLWRQIKELGKTSFMDWRATGTSSFMAKEVLSSKLRAFADFALSNPATAQEIDVNELLTQTWDIMEVGRESPIMKKDGSTDPAMMQAQQQMQQQMQQMQMQAQQMAEQMQQMRAALDAKDVDRERVRVEQYNAETARMVAQSQAEAQLMQMQKPQQMAQSAPIAGPQPVSPEMAAHESRRANAETQIMEMKAKMAESEHIAKRREADPESYQASQQALATMPQMMQTMNMIGQALRSMQDTLGEVAHLSTIAAGPRRSELQLDSAGMPVGSISYPINNRVQ